MLASEVIFGLARDWEKRTRFSLQHYSTAAERKAARNVLVVLGDVYYKCIAEEHYAQQRYAKKVVA